MLFYYDESYVFFILLDYMFLNKPVVLINVISHKVNVEDKGLYKKILLD